MAYATILSSIRTRRVSMMRCINIVVIAATLMLLVGACTITPDTYTIATADDHRITLKDIQDSPNFVQVVREAVVKLLVFDAASAQGISVTKEQIDEKVDEMLVSMGGEESLDDWLRSMGMELDDLQEMFRFNLTLVELAKSKIDVTDDEVKAEFEMNPEHYRREYAREFDLTVDEVENLTFEDMKEYLVDQYKIGRAYPMMDTIIKELEATAEIDYLYLSPEEREEMKVKQEKEREKIIPAETAVEEQPLSVTIEENGSGEEPAPGEEAVEDPETSTDGTEEPRAAEESPAEGEDTTSATEDDAAEADAEAGETEVEDETSGG
jgi:hypothetical protein